MKRRLALSVLAIGILAGAAQAKEAASATVGKPAPEFTLTDTNGKTHKLSDSKGKYVVLEWINHQCPFVKKHYDSGNMQALQKEWTGKEVVWYSINTSAPGKEGHTKPEEANALTQEKAAAPTALLLDTDGKVGKAYGAKTTPHMYVINPEGVLVYKGAIDDKASTDVEDVKGAKNYVSAALTEAQAGKPVSEPLTKEYGCSVKYK